MYKMKALSFLLLDTLLEQYRLSRFVLCIVPMHRHTILPGLINKDHRYVPLDKHTTLPTEQENMSVSPLASKYICYLIHQCLSCLPSSPLCCHGYAIPMATAGLYEWPQVPNAENSLNLH